MRVIPKSVEHKSAHPAIESSPQRQESSSDAVPSDEKAEKTGKAEKPEWGATHFVGGPAAVDKVVAPTVKTPTQVVDDFYAAFERKDGKAMTAAYAPTARFSDKVFPSLDGAGAGAMWRMLTRSKDLKTKHEIVKVEGDTVTARWIANYPAPGTGRPVENHVTATIKVKDGKIVDHKDDFDMNKWVRMAFGGVAALPFVSGALAGITRHLAGRQLKSVIADGG